MFTGKQNMDSGTDGSNLAVSVNDISNNQDKKEIKFTVQKLTCGYQILLCQLPVYFMVAIRFIL